MFSPLPVHWLFVLAVVCYCPSIRNWPCHVPLMLCCVLCPFVIDAIIYGMFVDLYYSLS
jgi:hypothetical protein